MRILVQRAKSAKVVIGEREVAAIDQGLLIFVGVAKDDTTQDIQYLANKVVNLRIFEDESGKMNLSIRQVNGEILSVPQFTLFAGTSGGNRPGFEACAEPLKAKQLWEELNSLLISSGLIVKSGIFGSDMQVSLINYGPVTIWLDSRDKT